MRFNRKGRWVPVLRCRPNTSLRSARDQEALGLRQARPKQRYTWGSRSSSSSHPTKQVSTSDHPVRASVGRLHRQAGSRLRVPLHPIKGKPKNLDRTAAPDPDPRAERSRSSARRSTMSSSTAALPAARRTRDNSSNKQPRRASRPKSRKKAFEWLRRELDDARHRSSSRRRQGRRHRCLCCFYEFRYRPVADDLKNAIDRGVDVRIIVDAKVNEFTDKRRRLHRASRAKRTCR